MEGSAPPLPSTRCRWLPACVVTLASVITVQAGPRHQGAVAWGDRYERKKDGPDSELPVRRGKNRYKGPIQVSGVGYTKVLERVPEKISKRIANSNSSRTTKSSNLQVIQILKIRQQAGSSLI